MTDWTSPSGALPPSKALLPGEGLCAGAYMCVSPVPPIGGKNFCMSRRRTAPQAATRFFFRLSVCLRTGNREQPPAFKLGAEEVGFDFHSKLSASDAGRVAQPPPFILLPYFHLEKYLESERTASPSTIRASKERGLDSTGSFDKLAKQTFPNPSGNSTELPGMSPECPVCLPRHAQKHVKFWSTPPFF